MLKIENNQKAREWLNFIVSTERIQEVVSDALKTRYDKRKRALQQKATNLPAIQQQQEASAGDLAKKYADLQKAEAAYRQARQAHGQAYQRDLGLASTYLHAEGAANKEIAELADPRILVMARWVMGLSNKVRAADRAWPVITNRLDGGRRASIETNSNLIGAAISTLDDIHADLRQLLLIDYSGAELEAELTTARTSALQAAATVLNALDMQAIEDEAPDLSEISPADLSSQ